MQKKSFFNGRPGRWQRIVLVGMLLAGAVGSGWAQKRTRGIVVDSLTMSAMPGVQVMIKSTKRGTITDATGTFVVNTSPTDTLVLTSLGYRTVTLPLLFEEEDIMIRMSERVRMLKEITITGARIGENDIIRTEHTKPQKMTVRDAFASPWEYFSRDQKERRKVVKLINENDRIKTYIKIVNDETLRETIMEELDITETQYYATLAQFNQYNQQDRTILYSTDPEEIVLALRSFFARVYH